MRDAESYKAELYQRLPRGPIWPKATEEATVWDMLLDVCSEEYNRVRADIDAWLYDFFPDQAEQQLAEWERALGLPDCGLALGTTAERQAAIVARLRRRGDPTLANIQAIAIAFDNGAVVSVSGTTGSLFFVGIATVGDTPVGGDEAASTVTITYGGPQSDLFECTMLHALPIHVTVTFVVI